MIQIKKLGMISDERLLNAKFDLKQMHEEKVLADLIRIGCKFITWEWQHEAIPVPHLVLMVTFEDNQR